MILPITTTTTGFNVQLRYLILQQQGTIDISWRKAKRREAINEVTTVMMMMTIIRSPRRPPETTTPRRRPNRPRKKRRRNAPKKRRRVMPRVAQRKVERVTTMMMTMMMTTMMMSWLWFRVPVGKEVGSRCHSRHGNSTMMMTTMMMTMTTTTFPSWRKVRIAIRLPRRKVVPESLRRIRKRKTTMMMKMIYPNMWKVKAAKRKEEPRQNLQRCS